MTNINTPFLLDLLVAFRDVQGTSTKPNFSHACENLSPEDNTSDYLSDHLLYLKSRQMVDFGIQSANTGDRRYGPYLLKEDGKRFLADHGR